MKTSLCWALVVVGAIGCGGAAKKGGGGGGGDKNPPPFTGQTGTILFVTQVPVAAFASLSSTFSNHTGDVQSAPRGGDLMIRYPDGTLRNLTREAGFGGTGLQGDNAIAVREPAVHWSGNRALFSMVVGAPQQYKVNEYRWQIYEVTGYSQGGTVAITKIANQPTDYNNVSPSYASDDRILFTSDRPRSGDAYLYPQLDEYESTATTTGIWNLDPKSGDLFIVNHTPSGAFSPRVDSFGRIVFTKWDHLQRDQQADADRDAAGTNGSYTFASEAADAMKIDGLVGQEVFPEPRAAMDPDKDPNVALHTFNQFFPWMINQDGTGEETVNHIGRHELGGSYSDGSFLDDPNLTYLTPPSDHANRYKVEGDGGMFHLREDPKSPGTYYASYVREFGTAGAGALIKFAGGPTVNPEDLEVLAVTNTDCYLQPDSGHESDAPNSTGHYRNPLPMTDGTLVASHTPDVGPVANGGTTASPNYNYEFRLKVLEQVGNEWVAKSALTDGISADITYYNPDTLVSFNGKLWELDAVEVAPRTVPTATVETIDDPEMSVFTDQKIDLVALRKWLTDNQLALIISRNVTARDRADVQQPYNLQVPGGVSKMGKAGKMYDVAFMQIFQGDQLRSYTNKGQARRVLARPMHGGAISPTPTGAAAGSVAIGLDGSMAAFVPARRALSWQLNSPTGTPVVRERNWVSFQAGEIRTCPVCHGINKMDQSGAPVPTNSPEALRDLMKSWQQSH